MDEMRHIEAQGNANGDVVGKTTTSPVNNTSRSQMVVPPANVIPVIFLPGIMGSNLKAKTQRVLQRKVLANAGDPVWRVDSAFSFGMKWKGRSAAERQILIDKDHLDVDNRGIVDALESSERASRATVEDIKQDNPALADMLSRQLDAASHMRASRRARGWGAVSWEFYGDFLNWLEFSLSNLSLVDGKPSPSLAALLDLKNSVPVGSSKRAPGLSEDLIKKMMLIQFPIHAFGYNWADSNLNSGALLAKYINDTIKSYSAKPGLACSKVILVTHSMGGLVARAATMASNAKSSVLAVIHGVMPTHGAAAMYKRAVAGFGGETYTWNPISRLVGRIGSKALGASSLETVPILAFNPGPFELAPNKLYNNGHPWLVIKDKRGNIIKKLPEKGDPYSEIYRRTDVWWRAVDPQKLNPAAQPGTPGAFLGRYMACIAQAESYHDKLGSSGFHPNTFGHYSADSKHAAWGEIVFEVVATEMYTPPIHSVGLGAPVLSLPQKVEVPNKQVGTNVDRWSIVRHDGNDRMDLRNESGIELKATILRKADPGDSTVPMKSSAAGLDPHARLVCKHVPGYEHDASYGDERVRLSVLDAIIRSIESVQVIK